MADLIETIRNIVGETGIISGDDVATRPADWLGHTNCQAKAIIRPKTTEELSEVMKLCHTSNQNVIAAGGLTGLVHGTDATGDDVIISFERMTAIENIDPIGRTMTVECGVPLQKVQEAADEHGLLFAVDLGARGSATIGGNIATNAGGNQVIRYGMMREQVLGLEAVLADGTILSSMNTLLKNNAGYDLKQLFIGSEGTLGLVTRAVLRLRPKPISETTAIMAMDDFQSLTSVFQYMSQGLAGSLTAFEVMWQDHYELVAVESGKHQPPLQPGSKFYAIIEAGGMDPEYDEAHFLKLLETAFEKEWIGDAVLATSDSQREQIWNIREDIETLLTELSPVCVFDVSLPINQMETYTEQLKSAVNDRWGDNGKVIIFGHLGDGNLHVGIAPRPWSEDARHEAECLVYQPLASIGGSVSAEHGIGLEKKNWLHTSRSAVEIDMMRQLKSALDPKNILNSDKIFSSTST